ncbi:PAS domain S-box protein [Arthrobacter pascens]|uniref:PAS domain S-box protein n=1 Tax=Arthrobacter pascens TaxID=1677 RepID=UPI003555DC2F
MLASKPCSHCPFDSHVCSDRNRGSASKRASREWLWAVGCDGGFTSSSPPSRDLLGYEPSELLGQHCSDVIDFDELAAARKATSALEHDAGTWSALLTVCCHRDGTRGPVEIASRPGQGLECLRDTRA